jgi:hypothetical protein
MPPEATVPATRHNGRKGPLATKVQRSKLSRLFDLLVTSDDEGLRQRKPESPGVWFAFLCTRLHRAIQAGWPKRRIECRPR